MSQSKRSSLLEACINILIGFTINLVAQIVIFPLFGLQASFLDNLGIGLSFTLISLARSYCIRRWFNKKQQDEGNHLVRCENTECGIMTTSLEARLRIHNNKRCGLCGSSLRRN